VLKSISCTENIYLGCQDRITCVQEAVLVWKSRSSA